MALRAVRLILGVVLILAAIGACIQASRLLAGSEADLDKLVLPIGLILGSLAVLGAYYGAMFASNTAFKGFRLVLGVVVGILVYFLVAQAGVHTAEVIGKLHSLSSAGELDMATAKAEAARLGGPLVRVVIALAVVLLYYFGTVAATGARKVLENIFSIPELLKKLGFTLGLLCIYRIGFHIPLPGLDQNVLKEVMEKQQTGVFGQALEYVAMFTGGDLQRSTIFGLGIMPYISASIIFQLLVAVVPALEKLQKEGQAGYKKIQEYTRYATVGLCLMQASFWMNYLRGNNMLYTDYKGSISVVLMGVLGMTCGTIFLMWLGEQIDEYGIGNGISLIIMAGIVSRLPVQIMTLIRNASLKVTSAGTGQIGLIKIVFLIAAFVFVVAGSILICQAQRRIPIQQAKHTRGRRVFGGQRQYLPLRVNHGGVMPIIFASSLMIFPATLFRWLDSRFHHPVTTLLSQTFNYGSVMYNVLFVAMIFFFAFFWTTVQFRPKDMSDQLRDYGSFIPGLRPGKRTADYLERVMERITYCGAAFLAVIAVIPQAAAGAMGIPFGIASFLGGTALLIMVAVALDLVQRIESNLIMRSYGGFLGDSGARIKGTR